MDKLTKEQRSQLMSRIKPANTEFEKRIFKELKKRGIRFRTHYVGAIGKPDIVQLKSRKAVFLHSDFWHGWRLPRWENILPSEFWKKKLKKNRSRDRKVIATLRRRGWKVLVLWEHTYEADLEGSLLRIAKFLD